jgi:RNA-directed DNA polymerase
MALICCGQWNQLRQRGERFVPAVLEFNHNMEGNIFKLQDELKNGDYQSCPYNGFYINEPKKRLISVASYCGRVVHHALCNIIEPIFEQAFIYDTYDCRKKGTHKIIPKGIV